MTSPINLLGSCFKPCRVGFWFLVFGFAFLVLRFWFCVFGFAFSVFCLGFSGVRLNQQRQTP
jgi:hypothetical protein